MAHHETNTYEFQVWHKLGREIATGTDTTLPFEYVDLVIEWQDRHERAAEAEGFEVQKWMRSSKPSVPGTCAVTGTACDVVTVFLITYRN